MPLQNGDVSKTVRLFLFVIPIRPVKSGGRTSECHFFPLVGQSKVVVS
jgi:hypothetical protein